MPATFPASTESRPPFRRRFRDPTNRLVEIRRRSKSLSASRFDIYAQAEFMVPSRTFPWRNAWECCSPRIVRGQVGLERTLRFGIHPEQSEVISGLRSLEIRKPSMARGPKTARASPANPICLRLCGILLRGEKRGLHVEFVHNRLHIDVE